MGGFAANSVASRPWQGDVPIRRAKRGTFRDGVAGANLRGQGPHIQFRTSVVCSGMSLPTDDSRTSEPLTGLVLAGGRSRRFGSDKSLHPIGDTTLRAAAAAKPREVCDRVLLSLPRDATAAAETLFDGVVTDEYAEAGPLAGIHAAMNQSGAPVRLLVMPCDMPDVTVDTLRRLTSGPRETAAVAIHRGREIGVLACYPAVLLNELAERLHTGGDALRVANFVRALPAVEFIELSDAESLNVNHPSDLSTGARVTGGTPTPL